MGRILRQWWHPVRPEVVRHQEVVREAHKQYSETLNRTMLALLGVALFCVLTVLGSPDKLLLATDSTIKVPFADAPMSFFGFIVVAPFLLIVVALYLHIFYGCWLECEWERQYINQQRLIPPFEGIPTLFSLPAVAPRLLTGFIFYSLVPLVLGIITWKAWAFPAMGLPLTYVSGVVTVVLVLLQLRRTHHQSTGWTRLCYILLILVINCMVLVTFSPQLFYRPLYLFRAVLADAWLVGIDMHRATLDFANLQRATLQGANLQKASLQGAKLPEANLQGANLQKANLQLANLQKANLSGAKLPEANLLGADLQRATLLRANLLGADLQRATLQGATLQGATLQKATLREANLQEANLQKATLQGANLSGADLSGANLQSADLSGADLSGAKLPEAPLPGVKRTEATLQLADLLEANFQLPTHPEGALQLTTLLEAALDRSHLLNPGANLSGANLSGANLSGANLQSASLLGANLQKANLQKANLQKANLQEANLQEANLSGANLQEANLTGVSNLTQDQLSAACGDENTKLPVNPEILTPPPPCPQ